MFRTIATRVSIIFLLLLMWGCDYARMNETESVKTYEKAMPEVPEGTVPIRGGLHFYREVDPKALRNPLPQSAATIARGQRAYGYYCVMCHGPEYAGNGTVGQSFYPLPTELTGVNVQHQTDGVLFYRISFGFKRHPFMADTVTESDRWALVHFIRALSSPSSYRDNQ